MPNRRCPTRRTCRPPAFGGHAVRIAGDIHAIHRRDSLDLQIAARFHGLASLPTRASLMLSRKSRFTLPP